MNLAEDLQRGRYKEVETGKMTVGRVPYTMGPPKKERRKKKTTATVLRKQHKEEAKLSEPGLRVLY